MSNAMTALVLGLFLVAAVAVSSVFATVAAFLAHREGESWGAVGSRAGNAFVTAMSLLLAIGALVLAAADGL